MELEVPEVFVELSLQVHNVINCDDLFVLEKNFNYSEVGSSKVLLSRLNRPCINPCLVCLLGSSFCAFSQLVESMTCLFLCQLSTFCMFVEDASKIHWMHLE